MAKLGDFISPAKNIKCGDGKYPVLSMTMHDGIVLQSDRFKKSLASADQSGYKVVDYGQLVVGFPIDEGVLYLQRVIEQGIMSPAYNVWDVDYSHVDPSYFELSLHSPQAMQYYKENLRGSTARRRSLPKEVLLELPLKMPSMDEQKRVATSIDKLTHLIDMRSKQLDKLDELVKSRFIEMFGDPIRNTQNRPTTDFINVVKMQRGFDLPVQDRQQDGNIPVFGSNGALARHNVAKVQGGGVITGRSGTIGKVYYTEGDYWPLNTSLFSVDTHGNNIIYLAYLLKMYDLSRFTEGTGVPTLNRNKFHNEPIIDVSLLEQETFAAFVKQVDKSKLVAQRGAVGRFFHKRDSLHRIYLQ